MQLSWGPITVNFGKNGKYVKKEECGAITKNFTEYLDRKLEALTLDRNTQLLNLKTDLLTHIDIKFSILKRDG